jgi:hypothetical protein
MLDARIVATSTHGLALAAQFPAARVDRIAASSHGRAFGLIMRGVPKDPARRNAPRTGETGKADEGQDYSSFGARSASRRLPCLGPLCGMRSASGRAGRRLEIPRTRMLELAKRLRLDLADALAGDRELLADLFPAYGRC